MPVPQHEENICSNIEFEGATRNIWDVGGEGGVNHYFLGMLGVKTPFRGVLGTL